MVDVEKLSDAELRTKLLEFGFPVMPITGTTRKVMTKKLKLLLENKNKAVNNSEGRRSLGRYSSEEESDNEVKVTRREKNRRVTMAAPVMQPPLVSNRGRKSTRLNETADTEIVTSPSKRESKTSTTTSATRTQKILKTAQDEFDTGSDSESDIVGNTYNSSSNNIEYRRGSPTKISQPSYVSSVSPPKKSLDSSYNRNVSFSSTGSPSRMSSYISSTTSTASDYASDRLNQIRSRLSLSNTVYDKPLYSPTIAEKAEKEETPFLSNFTRRLSALSNQKNEYDYKNDIIKEHDVNGSSAYARGQLSSCRTTRGRDSTYDYKSNQNSILRNNVVSFAVLAGAALFFIFLAIMYLGMKSDTSIITSGKNPNPYSKH